MKRTILIFVSMLFMTSLFCEIKLEKVTAYKNEKEGVYIRLDVNAQDDITGNDVFFDEYGNLRIYQRDSKKILLINKSFQIEKSININTDTSLQTFQSVGSNILMGNHSSAFYFNEEGVESFRINIFYLLNKMNGDGSNWFNDCYYDKESDILFFTLSTTGTIPYSIIHPSLDENQNQKNYRNAEETRKLLESGEYAPHLSCNDKGALILDGWNGYYWYGEKINRICYQYVDEKRVSVFVPNNTQRFNFSSDDEQVESIAFHPSGDIYVLRMNWQTNTHNLYRVENTWDPQWRKEWYENHETENVSQTVPSTNVAVNKEMTCRDNLRLRSEEATSSKVITTMQKGTRVKILNLGKAETIDGITSNWVQVEVLADAKDKDGKSIKAGTIGWCYGGYLEKK